MPGFLSIFGKMMSHDTLLYPTLRLIGDVSVAVQAGEPMAVQGDDLLDCPGAGFFLGPCLTREDPIYHLAPNTPAGGGRTYQENGTPA